MSIRSKTKRIEKLTKWIEKEQKKQNLKQNKAMITKLLFLKIGETAGWTYAVSEH